MWTAATQRNPSACRDHLWQLQIYAYTTLVVACGSCCAACVHAVVHASADPSSSVMLQAINIVARLSPSPYPADKMILVLNQTTQLVDDDLRPVPLSEASSTHHTLSCSPNCAQLSVCGKCAALFVRQGVWLAVLRVSAHRCVHVHACCACCTCVRMPGFMQASV